MAARPHLTEPFLRNHLAAVLQRLVDASDVVLAELECSGLATVAVRHRTTSGHTSLAVTGLPVPASQHLPAGTLWITTGGPDALDQARSWPVVIGLLLDAELARQDAEAAARQALEIASRDPATGLGNRRAWEHTLRTEAVRAHRSGQPLAVLVLDIDGLKAVNDARGHAMGDALISRAADALSELRRATDEVCRLGGDEFGIAAPDTDEVQARLLASRVRKGLQEVGVRVSLGFAVGRDPFEGHDLWHRADASMYEDKRARRPSWDLTRAEAHEAQLAAVARMPRP